MANGTAWCSALALGATPLPSCGSAGALSFLLANLNLWDVLPPFWQGTPCPPSPLSRVTTSEAKKMPAAPGRMPPCCYRRAIYRELAGEAGETTVAWQPGDPREDIAISTPTATTTNTTDRRPRWPGEDNTNYGFGTILVESYK